MEQRGRGDAMLPDGTYDVLIVDAEEVAGEPEVVALDLTLVAGDRKGEVVSLRARGLGRSVIDLMGLPGTLTVSGGEPSVVVDA